MFFLITRFNCGVEMAHNNKGALFETAEPRPNLKHMFVHLFRNKRHSKTVTM